MPTDTGLTVPPFAPDLPPPSLVRVPVPADAAAALTDAGVTLPGQLRAETLPGGLPVWTVPVGDVFAALPVWLRARAAHAGTGLWPVLVDSDGLASIREFAAEGGLPTAGDGAAFLAGRLDELAEDLAEEAVDRDPDTPAIDWTDIDVDEFLSMNEEEDLFDTLLLVPAAAGWLVPGLLGWTGATNADLMGDAHASVLRRWSAAWGADLFGLSVDVMVLRVTAPPTDPADALTVASEVFLYDPDAVYQGTETLDRLATMTPGSAWRLWWD